MVSGNTFLGAWHVFSKVGAVEKLVTTAIAAEKRNLVFFLLFLDPKKE